MSCPISKKPLSELTLEDFKNTSIFDLNLEGEEPNEECKSDWREYRMWFWCTHLPRSFGAYEIPPCKESEDEMRESIRFAEDHNRRMAPIIAKKDEEFRKFQESLRVDVKILEFQDKLKTCFEQLFLEYKEKVTDPEYRSIESRKLISSDFEFLGDYIDKMKDCEDFILLEFRKILETYPEAQEKMKAHALNIRNEFIEKLKKCF